MYVLIVMKPQEAWGQWTSMGAAEAEKLEEEKEWACVRDCGSSGCVYVEPISQWELPTVLYAQSSSCLHNSSHYFIRLRFTTLVMCFGTGNEYRIRIHEGGQLSKLKRYL
jgi:hypothetical protein